MRKAGLFLFTIGLLLFMSGCGSQSSAPAPIVTTTQANVPVGLTVTDDPPAGVTVLFFQLNITGGTLTDSTGGSVPLLSSTNPIPVNVSQLQTDVAFIGSQSVAAGTYTGLSLTFANPQLTIFNASDTAISATCAVGKVCQLTPTATPLTLNFTTAPFPVTLSASSPLAFKLDIHMDTVIQSDLSLNLAATNGVTIDEVVPPVPRGPIPHVGNLIGTIQTVGTSQFTLQTIEGRSFTIDTSSSTTYSGFPTSVCSTEAFGCLANGQAVQVTLTMQTDGTLLAAAVNFIQLPTQQTVTGNIVGLSTSSGNTIMDLIIQQQPMAANATALPVGRHARVTVPSTGVTYAVDSGSFVIPSGLSFASASDLQVGQQVKVVVSGTITTPSTSGTNISTSPGPVGPPDVLFTASSISLGPSQITGTVAGVNAGALTFTLATMPVLFVPPSATAGGAPNFAAPVIITIQTTAATTFANVTGLSGLNINDYVSVAGWVFSTPTGLTKITIAADTVVERGATPLF
jgi:hypothetical protein